MLLGIAGRAGVGKTTIARKLEGDQGYVIRSFAYPVKKTLVAMTGLPMEYFTEIELKERVVPWIGKTPRQLMQLLATDLVRDMIDPDFWVKRMRQTLHETSSDVNVVIDDIRAENEAALVRELGGIVVHLHRNYECPTKEINHKFERGIEPAYGDIVLASGGYNERVTYSDLNISLRFREVTGCM